MMGKSACLTLMDDIIQALDTSQGKENAEPETIELLTCSGDRAGCYGNVKLRHYLVTKPVIDLVETVEPRYLSVARELSRFPMFKALTETEITEVVPFFKLKEFKEKEIVIRKGDPGVKLYVVLSGSVDIIGDYGMTIASLGQGEVFGEMSLLSGNPVSSTVQAAQKSRILYMFGSYFRIVLNRYPALQMYFARLLVERLARSNMERSMEFASGMAGSLSEISPAELFQTLNMTQKTGVLDVSRADQKGRVLFHTGEVVLAEFAGKTGQDAFFEMVKQRQGNFKFQPGLPAGMEDRPVLGDFMYLLMEGLNRLDEESATYD